MKRNGIEQQQVNGRKPFDLLAQRNGRRANGDKSNIARKIEQSISYMLQHLNQPLHVSTLASAVNVSPSHYSALFKLWTGCPPIDYFIHLRMQHACRLFDSTPWNVKEVAAALGYDDPFYFSRTFKAVNRVAPSEYRAMPEKLKNSIRSATLSLISPGYERDPVMQEDDIGRVEGSEPVRCAGQITTADRVFEPLEKKN
jgi:AraC-like DNA-binding protein